jgi:hypothetical protein
LDSGGRDAILDAQTRARYAGEKQGGIDGNAALQSSHAVSSSIEIEISDKPETVLVVRTNLSLWLMSDDYREDAVNRLATDAQVFQLKYNINRVRLVSIGTE